jgi:hypothetical protein
MKNLCYSHLQVRCKEKKELIVIREGRVRGEAPPPGRETCKRPETEIIFGVLRIKKKREKRKKERKNEAERVWV